MNIGEGIVSAIVTLIVIAFLVGAGIFGTIWLIDRSRPVKIKSKTILVPDTVLTTDGKNIDTFYIYKKPKK